MADSNLLAALLSGQDPLAPGMVPGYQGAQLSAQATNPEFGHNEGLFGALAKTLAGFAGPNMLQNSVQNTTAARTAAQPDLARLLAQPDPYAAAAQNPQAINPIALSRLTNASPLQVAQTREASANAALAGLNVSGFGAAQGQGAPVGPVAAPASKTIAPAPPGGGLAAIGNGRYQQEPSDPIAQAAAMSPQQRQALLQNPQARAGILMRLRMLAAQRAQGGGNAARPQP